MKLPFSWARLLTSSTVLLVAGALLLYAVGQCSGASSEREARQIAETRIWLKARRARMAEADSLRAAAQRAAEHAHRSAIRAAQQSASDTAFERELRVAKTAPDSVPLLVTQRDSARAAAASWREAFFQMSVARIADSIRADRAEAQLGEAEQRLAGLLKIAECRLMGLSFAPRCPSRTTSYVLGAATGAFLIIATR